MARSEFSCRYCGRHIIADEDAAIVLHEAPECAPFVALVAGHTHASLTVSAVEVSAAINVASNRARARC